MREIKSFTLAELLIVISIIGIIAIATVPMLINNYTDKSLKTKLKKTYNTIMGAIESAKLEENISETSAILAPEDSENLNLALSQKFAKYINVIKICENPYVNECSSYYYQIKSADNNPDSDIRLSYLPVLVLSDGTSMYLQQWSCPDYDYCANIYVDVNGEGGPNKFGKDVFQFRLYKTGIKIDTSENRGGSAIADILYTD